MENQANYGERRPTPAVLAGLTVLAKSTICGDEHAQERYYKAEEIEALVAKLTAPLADAELAELAALEQQATAGPWTCVVKGNTVQSHAIPGVCSGISPKTRNGAFICALRNTLPGLLARLAAALKLLEGYEQWEANVLSEDAAWSTPAAHPWQTDELYDEWMRLQEERNEVLRPTVEGAQPRA